MLLGKGSMYVGEREGEEAREELLEEGEGEKKLREE
jgi:hypothetical protein